MWLHHKQHCNEWEDWEDRVTGGLNISVERISCVRSWEEVGNGWQALTGRAPHMYEEWVVFVCSYVE